MRIGTWLAGIALAATMAGAASATVTVTLTGTSTSNTLAGADTSFTATIVYDETTAVSSGFTSAGNYTQTFYAGAVQSASFTSGGVTASFTGATASFAQIITTDSVKSYPNDSEAFSIGTSGSNYINASLSGPYTTVSTTQIVSPDTYASGSFAYTTNSGNYYGTINSISVASAAASAVPEPASWAMLIGGFGLVGAALRRQRVIPARGRPLRH